MREGLPLVTIDGEVFEHKYKRLYVDTENLSTEEQIVGSTVSFNIRGEKFQNEDGDIHIIVWSKRDLESDFMKVICRY